MKTNRTILLVPLMLLLSICYCTSRSPDSELRKALQDSYNQYLSSLQSEDEEKIRNTMSSHAYAVSKNDCANLKTSFVKEEKKAIRFMPKISKLDFVKIVHAGSTAALLYSKDTKEEHMPGPSITFILIKFVDEGSGWKYDGVYSETTSKYRADGSQKQFDEVSLPPEYAIDGKIHPPPPLLHEAEVVGFFYVSSHGYKVEVVINNRIQAIIDDNNLFSPVKGGLKFGENVIEFKCTKTTSTSGDFSLNLTVKAKHEEKDEEVFVYKPRLKIEGKHTYSFMVL